jgi:manganese transport protein
VVPLIAAVGSLLAYVILEPLVRRFRPGSMRGEPAVVPVAAGSRRAAPAAAPVAAARPALPPSGRPTSAPPGLYKKVAVALEMGAADAAVLQHVRDSLAVPGADLVLLHVVESAAGRYLGPESSDQESRADLAALEAIAAELRELGATVSVALGFGDPKSELARLVMEAAADLVVTGSHGHGGLQDVLFGATVSGLRHRVHCPVLTVPPVGPPRS